VPEIHLSDAEAQRLSSLVHDMHQLTDRIAAEGDSHARHELWEQHKKLRDEFHKVIPPSTNPA
jgi:hypothetical protein